MSKSIDLGYKSPYGMACCAPESKKEVAEPIIYPSFSIENKPALIKALLGKAGKEVTGTVTIKVVAVNVRDGGSRPYDTDRCSAELEIRSIQLNGVAVAEEKDEEVDAKSALAVFLGDDKD